MEQPLQQTDVLRLSGEIRKNPIWAKELSFFNLDFDHLKLERNSNIELFDILKTDAPSTEILEIYEKTEMDKDQLALWANYGGGTLYTNKSQLKSPLQTIIEYCENSTSDIKNRLRLVNQLLQQRIKAENFDPTGILSLLAAHGGVCNVQKEVGVRMAYAFLTDSMKLEMDKQSLCSAILRFLIGLRELIVEQVYMKTGQSTNVHYIIPFRNIMGPKIGLHHIPDPNSCTVKVESTHYFQFFEKYCAQFIVSAIYNGFNKQPRKLPYEVLVKWLQDNPPTGYTNSYDFLEESFDENTGCVKETTIVYVLHKLKILIPISEKTVQQQIEEFSLAPVPVSARVPAPAPVNLRQNDVQDDEDMGFGLFD